jgi:hypothetical protein
MNQTPFINKELQWNQEIEDLLKNKQIECTKYSWLHNKDCENYYNYNNYLFITNAFLTSLSACSVIMSNALFRDISLQAASIINISFGAVLIFSTGLSSFQHMTNYIERSNAHKTAMAKFTSLGNNMLKLLALDKSSKQTSIEFFNWAEAEFTNLQIISPTPSEYALKCYKKDNPQIINDVYDTTCIDKMDISNANYGQNEDHTDTDMQQSEIKQTMEDFAIKRWTMNL